MTAEELARSIGEAPSCPCGCERCGRDIHALYRAALDQAAWIREQERRLAEQTRRVDRQRAAIAKYLPVIKAAKAWHAIRTTSEIYALENALDALAAAENKVSDGDV